MGVHKSFKTYVWLPEIAIGGGCTGEGQCQGTGVQCANLVCSCPQGQYFDQQTEACLNRKNFLRIVEVSFVI